MFQRDETGHTPQFSNYLDARGLEGEAEFEMDLGCGPSEPGPAAAASSSGSGASASTAETSSETGEDKKSLRRMDSVYDTSALSREEVARLNSCLDHILDIVGETVPEFTIKETIVKCGYDAEKALNAILNKSVSRVSFQQNQSGNSLSGAKKSVAKYGQNCS